MKGDFSRIRFAPAKHYTAVLQQQGRVVLDADQNEQAAIDAYLRGTELIDVVGPFGGPRSGGGFHITTSDGTMWIDRGRYYVHGLLCENERVLSYDGQPYLLNPGQSASDLFTELRNGTLSTVRVFLEVWQRLVTALDDTCLREPALGQADTTDRVQTVWRVVAEGVAATTTATAPGRVINPGSGIARRVAALESARRPMAETVHAAGGRFARAASKIPPAAPGGTAPGPGTAAGAEIGPVTADGPERGPVILGSVNEPLLLSPCCLEMYRTVLRPAGEGGRLSAQTSGGAADCTCEPTPPAGYRGLENQLYRVEIHQGGDQNTATFKWSRENGAVVSAVTGVSGANVTVDSLGPDPYLGFAPNQWVELTDDTYVFGPTPNQPGDLIQIQSVTPEELTITLAQTAPSVDPGRNARMRRWDQFGASAAPCGIPLSAGTWLGLESGIQIQFTAGHYLPGDYWLIPARTASGQIDWPPCDSDGRLFQPAQTTTVYRAPLACLHWDSKNEQIVVDDCRLLFSPLTELTPPAASSALHTTEINWSNDDVMTLDRLIANGLAVTLDQGATSRVDASAFIVSLEYARPVKEGYLSGGPTATVQRSVDILDGQVTVQGQTITWQMPWLPNSYAQFLTLEEIQQSLLAGARFSLFARARVRLLGHMIYGAEGFSAAGRGLTAGVGIVRAGTVAYLDGQSFGTPGARADGSARIDLQLPSGAAAKASDFESWFYLAPAASITNLAVQPSAVNVIQASGGQTVIGALATWARGTKYVAGTQILGPAQQVLQITTGGTSGAKQPQWSAATGALVRDGTVRWQVVSPAAVTPQGTVTLNYPAIADTAVGLSISGGTAGTVAVPKSVTVPAHQTSQTFDVTVTGNPGPSTQTYTITASLTPAVGNVILQSTTLSVTGF